MKLGIHFEIYASYVPNSFLSMDLVFKMKNEIKVTKPRLASNKIIFGSTFFR